MKKTYILLFFIVLKFAIQYVIIGPEYDLHRDEYLHLDQGKHLAWGYLSVPPFTSWHSWLILALENSEFWVKFFPALYGALTLLIVWKAIEILEGDLFALILGSTAITFSVLLRINMLYQPNSVDVFFWTLLYYTLLRYIKSENNNWLYATGIVLGLGFLNKYNILFQIIGLIPALLITNRKIFTNKHLYFAGAVALLIVLPNLIWQYQNNFPVVYHMKLLSKTQLVNVKTADFLKEQILFFMGSIFVLITAFISFFRYPPFRKFRLFFWAFAFTMGLFIFLKAKGYYAIGLYPIFLSFGSVYIEKLLTSKIKWLRPVTVAVILLSSIILFRVGFPTISPQEMAENSQRYKDLGLLRWEDGHDHALPQDFADMLGWKELAAKVDATYEKLDDKQHTLVLCDNYGQAGAINYYSKYGIQAVTMNADYINWVPLDEEIKNVILVQNADDDDKERIKEQPLFEKISLTGKVENKYAREYGASIYQLVSAKVSINKIIKSDIEENRWH
ncbi:glycosyltransferase family 39 protein [Dyadobacter sp. CY345]|uniref:glycosyltransferase family 39 protein n=1 Tax=Dyadobacter sp. CY345 TaxID=2909335 RepID=UPI001F2E01C1|nr:glycosyltransferase family 39 protein [Dyadobacter sp. CY345]MCF2444255.1 glycosyltransferase family 39 protein [Dyadobacter sp. CY345]